MKRTRPSALVASLAIALGLVLALGQIIPQWESVRGWLALLTVLALVGVVGFHFWRQRSWEHFQRELYRSYVSDTFDSVMREMPELPSDATGGTMEERLTARCAYVPTPYLWSEANQFIDQASLKRPVAQGSTVDYSAAELQARRSLLLIGEPGTGKSVTAFMVFARLAQAALLWEKSTPLPVLIRLNALRVNESRSLRDLLPPPLDQADEAWVSGIEHGRGFVFILDGLDELPFASGPRTEAAAQPSDLELAMTFPTLVTCREAFFDLYVHSSHLYTRFLSLAAIQPLEFQSHVEPYVEQFCRTRQRPRLADHITRILADHPKLRDLVRRILLLRLTTAVLFSDLESHPRAEDNECPASHDILSRLNLHGTDFLTASIYEEYIAAWLRRESQKADLSGPTSVEPLEWREKRALAEDVAALIFKTATVESKSFSQFELTDLVADRKSITDLVTDWCVKTVPQRIEGKNPTAVRNCLERRTFLIVNEHTGYSRFAHKSFYEYLLARHACRVLSGHDHSSDQGAAILSVPFPDEVIRFLREILAMCRGVRPPEGLIAQQIERNLWTTIRLDPNDSAVLMARQQAANLLPAIAPAERLGALRDLLNSEKSPFIRRAIAVGLALHHNDPAPLRDFVQEMDVDAEARGFHMGYNRIYYGDQVLGSGGYMDDGLPGCTKFFDACVRHIREPAYTSLQVMALATIHYLLADAGRNAYLRHEHRPGLEAALLAANGLIDAGYCADLIRAQGVARDIASALDEGGDEL
ncbi:MAG: NACHT domain-containing protein [Candidatus Saccharimonadales bacterium]